MPKRTYQNYIRRLQTLGEEKRRDEIQIRIDETRNDMLDDLGGIIAELNATEWDIDSYEITNIEMQSDSVEVQLEFHDRSPVKVTLERESVAKQRQQ